MGRMNKSEQKTDCSTPKGMAGNQADFFKLSSKSFQQYAVIPKPGEGYYKEGTCKRWATTGKCHFGKACYYAPSHVKHYKTVILGESLDDYLNKVTLAGGKKEGRKATKLSTTEVECNTIPMKEEVKQTKKTLEVAPLMQLDALLGFKTVTRKVGIKEQKPKVVKNNEKAFKKKKLCDF